MGQKNQWPPKKGSKADNISTEHNGTIEQMLNETGGARTQVVSLRQFMVRDPGTIPQSRCTESSR